MSAVLTLISAYLLGCFNTGFYLVKLLRGNDIRTISSGGTGSRNVGRILGAKGFLITLLGDAGKGILSVWLGQQFVSSEWLLYTVLLACICGHIWPFQLSFRGGKGFATFAGGMLLLAPLVLLAGFVLSLLFLVFLRRTTISGLIALAFSPAFMAVSNIKADLNWFSSGFSIYCLIVVVVLIGHRSNICKDFFTSLQQS